MKMPPVTKPTTEQLASFAASIRNAGSAGLNAQQALYPHTHVARWLNSILDFLPPELEALGLSCRKSGRGHRYTYDPATQANANVPGQKREFKEAKASQDWAWFALQVAPRDWINLADHIAKAIHDTPEPCKITHLIPLLFEKGLVTKGSNVICACMYHPEGLAPTLVDLLAERGVLYDRRTLSSL